MITIHRNLNILNEPGATEAVEYTGLALSSYLDDLEAAGHLRITLSEQGYVSPSEYDKVIPADDEHINIVKEINDPISAAFVLGGIALWSAGVAFGGGALTAIIALGMIGYGLSGMMGSVKPVTGAAGDWSSSATYGWDGIKNTADADVPVAIVYGKHRVGGNFINIYTVSRGGVEYAYLLIALCEGPIYKVAGVAADRTGGLDNIPTSEIGEKIMVDGVPIDAIDDAKVYVRHGSQTQTSIPGFQELHYLKTYDQKIQKKGVDKQPTEYVFQTDNTDVEKLIFNFTVPSLYKISDTEGTKAASIKGKLYYRVLNSGDDWAFVEGGTDALRQAGLTFEHNEENMTSKSLSYIIGDLTPDQYEIKIIKTSDDTNAKRQGDLILNNIDEVRSDNLRYPYTALLGLVIPAGEQASGDINTVTVEIEGRTIDYWNGSAWVNGYTANPVWCLRDLLTNVRYGTGNLIDVASIDDDLNKSNALHCNELVATDAAGDETETRYRMDVVLDSPMRALDLVNQLCASFCAMPVWASGSVNIVIDKTAQSVGFYGMGSIKKDSFQENWASVNQRYTQFDLQFTDKDNYYNRDTVTVLDHEGLASGLPLRVKTLWIPGVTRRTQAIRLGIRMASTCRLAVRTVSFATGVNGILSKVGQVVDVAYNKPKWGISSGRIITSRTEGANKVLTLTMDVTLEAGKTYYIKVWHSSDSAETKQVLSPAGVYATGTEITVAGSWTAAPVAYEGYSIGEQNILTKPFRIMEMTRNDDHSVTLSAVEYDALIYDESGRGLFVAPIQYSKLPDPRKLPMVVSNLKAVSWGGYDPSIKIYWQRAAVTSGRNPIDHVEVYVLRNGTYEKVGDSYSEAFVYRGAQPGVAYTFKVYSVSQYGKRSTKAETPTVTHTAATNLHPPDVKGLEIKGQGNNMEWVGKDVVLAWKRNANSAANYAAGEEPFGAGSGTEDYSFKEFRVEVSQWNASTKKWVIVRTAAVKTPEYTYTFEKNKADFDAQAAKGVGTVMRKLRVKVWQVDDFNNLSETAAVVEVSNPVPEAPDVSFSYVGEGNNLTITWRWPMSSDVDVRRYIVVNSADPSQYAYLIRYEGLATEYVWTNKFLSPVTSLWVAATDGFTENLQELNWTQMYAGGWPV